MIYCNDQSYVNISEKPVFHDKMKYIEIKNYILCDKVQKREVVLQYISTNVQIAGILVNNLSRMKSLETSWVSWR
jgi:hypothetical protein